MRRKNASSTQVLVKTSHEAKQLSHLVKHQISGVKLTPTIIPNSPNRSDQGAEKNMGQGSEEEFYVCACYLLLCNIYPQTLSPKTTTCDLL